MSKAGSKRKSSSWAIHIHSIQYSVHCFAHCTALHIAHCTMYNAQLTLSFHVPFSIEQVSFAFQELVPLKFQQEWLLNELKLMQVRRMDCGHWHSMPMILWYSMPWHDIVFEEKKRRQNVKAWDWILFSIIVNEHANKHQWKCNCIKFNYGTCWSCPSALWKLCCCILSRMSMSMSMSMSMWSLIRILRILFGHNSSAFN